MFLVLAMLLILVLGCFLEQIAIMLITLPVLMPIVLALSIDPIWFSVMMLINLEIALMTPPFGMLLFVIRWVPPPAIPMSEISQSAVPHLAINILLLHPIIQPP